MEPREDNQAGQAGQAGKGDGSAERKLTMPLGVVVRRVPGTTRWARWRWQAVSVLPGAAPAKWRILREDGGVTEYHAATLPLEIHRADTEAYLYNLSTAEPAIYVIMRINSGAGPDAPPDMLAVTASPYEAQDYADSGEDLVEKVPMPAGLRGWISAFVERHHAHEEFVKRRRDRAGRERADREGIGQGLGDSRIRQMSDVYRPPGRRGPAR